jgi:protein N-lysine methyltransferase METTL21A
MQFMKKAKKIFLVEEVEDEDRPIWERDRLFLYTFKSTSLTQRGDMSVESK